MRGAGGHRRTTFSSSRDSDASFASNRPSSAGLGRAGDAAAAIEVYRDQRYQSAAVATINAYLASKSATLTLRLPYPSAKDIVQTLTLLLSCLDSPSNKLDEDLPLLLKALNFPYKFNKSILKSPGTPHQWPTFLAIIHWLVQLAKYNDQTSADAAEESFRDQNPMNVYALQSYVAYITGDDDVVEELDREWLEKLEKERESLSEVVSGVERSSVELAAKVEAMKTEPSRKEALEREKAVLEEDVVKFEEMIDKLKVKIVGMESEVEEKEKEILEKEAETKRVREEIGELRKRVESQTVNPRDVDRMRRELQAVEREIGDAESARSSWEEKTWDLHASLGHRINEIEALFMECNQAIRRLKFGDGFQYSLNPKGSTVAEVMGIDYKSTIKPALESFAEDIKKNSIAKLEEFIEMQQQWSEVSAKMEGKRNHLARLESHITELETQQQSLRKVTDDYTSRCATEAKMMMEDVETESHNLDIVEMEAADILKASKLKLQEVVEESENKTQLCADELMYLIDSVSKEKELVQSKILEVKNDVSATAAFISEVNRISFQEQLNTVGGKK